MGERRLVRLSEAFDLAVERSFLEIHPETPPEGKPVSSLGYSPERWSQMMANLVRMGKEEDILFVERTFTANSHRALLLAEAVRESVPAIFESLNERLFRAYFGEARNIGDAAVLRAIAEDAGVPREMVERAWSDRLYEDRLKAQGEAASRMGIAAVPTFIFGRKWIVEGAVPTDMMMKVAREIAAVS